MSEKKEICTNIENPGKCSTYKRGFGYCASCVWESRERVGDYIEKYIRVKKNYALLNFNFLIFFFTKWLEYMLFGTTYVFGTPLTLLFKFPLYISIWYSILIICQPRVSCIGPSYVVSIHCSPSPPFTSPNILYPISS